MQFPELLEWYTLTEAVNEMRAPRAFLKNLLFSNTRELPTENVLFSVLSGDNETAPFVKKNGEAIMAGGYSEEEQQVSPPNIRLKRPLEAADLIFRRHAGDPVFVAGGGDLRTFAEREVSRQLQRLNDLVANAEEWLCAMAIRGSISYTAADQAHFQITFPKPAGNTVDLGAGNYWDESTSNPAADVMDVRQLMHDAVRLQPNVVILGSEAMAAFLANKTVQGLIDIRRLVSGQVDITDPLADDGSIRLGNWAGIEWRGYTASVIHQGASTPLIRSKYAEFIHVGPSAENVLYYGAIADLDALDAGQIVARRFSKSWRQQDPSVHQILVASRPLPVPRRPGSVVSVKVVSG